MYGYLPANQFNVDLCLDTISVLNRTIKDGKELTPYESFSNDHIDFERDFRCRWGELIIVKKPKGISSDLKVTGEWAMVVRRLMNHTGVIKVYLIGSKKYAYRLKFKRAVVPEWVVTAMNSISESAVIGFEEETEEENELPEVYLPLAGAAVNVIDINEDDDQEEPDPDNEELNEALRILERADEPELVGGGSYPCSC